MISFKISPIYLIICLILVVTPAPVCTEQKVSKYNTIILYLLYTHDIKFSVK